MAGTRTRGRGLAGEAMPRSVALLGGLVLALLAISVAGPVSFGGEEAEAAEPFEVALPVNPAELSDAQLNQALDTAKGAGVNSISTGAVWWYLNEGRPPRSYDWSRIDALVAGAQARGMKVSLQLSGTPDFVHPNLASTVGDKYTRIWYPPRGATELSHWSDFVTDTVTRYKGRVQRFELWNEPNLPEFWRPGPSPREYVPLLRTGYRAAKAADPNATVVFAGLSRNHVGYLETFYREADALYGAEAAQNRYYFDVLGVHPYSDERSPDTYSDAYVGQTQFGAINRNFLGLRGMKQAMEARGGAEVAKRIWVGEMGYSTTQTWMKAVPDDVRGRYLERAYALTRGLGYVDGMSWYYYRASSTDAQEWAIVNPDFSPTLTFEALKRATAASSGGTTPPAGPAPGDTGAVRVGALWTNKSSFAPGERVRASATLTAPTEGNLNQLVIAVRPKGGSQVLDFPLKNGVAVGPGARTYSFEKAFSGTGTYQYFVAYEDGAGWRNLTPVREFRVAAPAPIPAPAPTPAPAPAPNTRPEILYPSPVSSTRDRTPLIRALVRDRQDNLTEARNVRLYVDGGRISASRFSYSSSTDQLRYASRRLAYGAHRVTVVATDNRGLAATRAWTFRVRR